MPLLDHFRPPLSPRRHWESFHVNWAGAIADALNNDLLPEGYFAEEHARLGARVEIDVATFSESDAEKTDQRNGATATLPARTWAPPAAALVIPAAFPDEFEVLVFQSEGGTTLVAAIELVSPANKDRDAHRRAFAVKCAQLSGPRGQLDRDRRGHQPSSRSPRGHLAPSRSHRFRRAAGRRRIVRGRIPADRSTVARTGRGLAIGFGDWGRFADFAPGGRRRHLPAVRPRSHLHDCP